MGISMANFVFCDNTQNKVTSTAESNLIKKIKKYFEGSIDKYEVINFIKKNKDNFAVTENSNFSDQKLFKSLPESEKLAISCMDQSLWALGEEQGVEEELIT